MRRLGWSSTAAETRARSTYIDNVSLAEQEDDENLLSTSRTTIPFGSVEIGETHTATVTLTNNGALSTQVTALDTDNAAFSVSRAAPFVVAAGSSITNKATTSLTGDTIPGGAFNSTMRWSALPPWSR
jgi:hypothetical protein